ncbi:MAG: hypothetical protein Q7J84_17475 [Sulfuricaulis sp.]|nr:hypothetical protein [Sulfuricaulis sp.]
MSKPDGGPAFPTPMQIGANAEGTWFSMQPVSGGMTMRDYFAAVALQGIVSKLPFTRPIETRLQAIEANAEAARGAYCYADAMLAERDK